MRKRNGFHIEWIFWIACILLIIGFSRIHFSPIESYNLYYNDQVLYGGVEIAEGRRQTLEVDGKEVFIEWQDTSKLQPIGVVSERMEDNAIPESELAINCFVEADCPVYKIPVGDEEWLMVEYKLKNESSGVSNVVRYQHYFRTMD